MGKIHSTLKGHDGELVSLHFNSDGDLILTGSFDKTAIIWDARTRKMESPSTAAREAITIDFGKL